MPVGYSRTPLAKKLGIVDGFRGLLDPTPDGVDFGTSLRGSADVIVFCMTKRSELERRVTTAGKVIFAAGKGLWGGWPKRAAKVPTDRTEGVVPKVALPIGLVDNQVCAIGNVWLGPRIV
jgi:hypothetical protein